MEKIKENKNIYKKSNSIENDSNDEPMATKKAIKLAEKLKIEISNINVDGIVRSLMFKIFSKVMLVKKAVVNCISPPSNLLGIKK